MKKISLLVLSLILSVAFLVSCGTTEMTDGSSFVDSGSDTASSQGSDTKIIYTVDTVPEFNGRDAYVIINDNVPDFDEDDLVTDSYEFYSELDVLGRCGYTIASIGKDIMPTEERGSIGQVKPTGWHTVKYDNVDGKYLYNRCHLIGFQLTGENANVCNLITGTRYLNIEGMLPFENMVADYVKETSNHVLYRVTPIFDNDNLLARGVQIEAESVEDNGKGILFNVYAYNVQPGIKIDYKTGESALLSDVGNLNDTQNDKDDPTVNNNDDTVSDKNENQSYVKYILNTNSKKFHKIDCTSAAKISPQNRKETSESRDSIIKNGYSACKICNP